MNISSLMLINNVNFKSLVGQEGEFFGKALGIIVTKELTQTTDVNLTTDTSPIILILVSVFIGISLVLIGIKAFKQIDLLFKKKDDDLLGKRNKL